MKKSVEHIDGTDIELTRRLDACKGWVERTIADIDIKSYDRIVFLGTCEGDGQLFACYSYSMIDIWGGRLNGGTY